MTEADKATAPAPGSEPAGWGTPKPAHIPRATYFPAGTAFGITLFLWGFVTGPVLLLVGLAVLVASIAGWMGEMRHDR